MICALVELQQAARIRYRARPSTAAAVATFASFSNASMKAGAAVRVAGVVDGVHPDVQILRLQRLRVAEREREQDGVARRDVGDGHSFADRRVLGDLDLRGERRPSDRAQVERDDLQRRRERRGYPLRRLQLVLVPLPVPDGEGCGANPSSRAMARQVLESSPPEKRTTAGRIRRTSRRGNT